VFFCYSRSDAPARSPAVSPIQSPLSRNKREHRGPFSTSSPTPCGTPPQAGDHIFLHGDAHMPRHSLHRLGRRNPGRVRE